MELNFDNVKVVGIYQKVKTIKQLVDDMISEYRNQFPAWYATGKCFILMPKFLQSQIIGYCAELYQYKKHARAGQGEFRMQDVPVYHNYTDSIIMLHEDALLEHLLFQPILKIEGLLSGDVVVNFPTNIISF